jgi:hypothetical protein
MVGAPTASVGGMDRSTVDRSRLCRNLRPHVSAKR